MKSYESRVADPDLHIQGVFTSVPEVYLFKRCNCAWESQQPVMVNVDGDLRCCICGAVVAVESRARNKPEKFMSERRHYTLDAGRSAVCGVDDPRLTSFEEQVDCAECLKTLDPVYSIGKDPVKIGRTLEQALAHAEKSKILHPDQGCAHPEYVHDDLVLLADEVLRLQKENKEIQELYDSVPWQE